MQLKNLLVPARYALIPREASLAMNNFFLHLSEDECSIHLLSNWIPKTWSLDEKKLTQNLPALVSVRRMEIKKFLGNYRSRQRSNKGDKVAQGLVMLNDSCKIIREMLINNQ